MPHKIITIIQSSYSGAKCRVLHKVKLSEQFEVKSGVRQECILSPMLFLLVVNDVLEAALNDATCALRIPASQRSILIHDEDIKNVAKNRTQ